MSLFCLPNSNWALEAAAFSEYFSQTLVALSRYAFGKLSQFTHGGFPAT